MEEHDLPVGQSSSTVQPAGDRVPQLRIPGSVEQLGETVWWPPRSSDNSPHWIFYSRTMQIMLSTGTIRCALQLEETHLGGSQ